MKRLILEDIDEHGRTDRRIFETDYVDGLSEFHEVLELLFEWMRFIGFRADKREILNALAEMDKDE